MNLEDFITIVPCDTLPPGVVAAFVSLVKCRAERTHEGEDEGVVITEATLKIHGAICAG